MSELGPDNFNCTIALDRIFCYQPSDVDSINPWAADDEPYMWTFMVKIDGNGLQQQPNANYLTGEATYFISNGAEGNLGSKAASRSSLNIPKALGTWETSLKSIPISVAGQEVTKIPGIIILAAVLLEENLTPNSAIAKAHQSTVQLIKDTVRNTIASLGLAGFATDAAYEYAAAQARGRPITLEAAATEILNRRLTPVIDLFTVGAPSNVISTVLFASNAVGKAGSALDKDECLGYFVRAFTQAELAKSRVTRHDDVVPKEIKLSHDFWEQPYWAYSMYGQAFAHRKLVQRDPPSSNRLEIKWTIKRRKKDGDHGIRISMVAGDENGRGEGWAYTREQASFLIAGGEKSFYVKGPGEHIVEVRSVLSFLQTDSDQYQSNNLKNLPDPPPDADIGGWNNVWY